ncbi:MAG: hypothetical protein HY518_04260 [Candidatus Aenigmarchaeota archaeon]|nr:hypothetical protein [Candidatus Aenigmarchaeota archaeon]
MTNGVYVPLDRMPAGGPEPRPFICGDTAIALGAEEAHRRTVGSIQEYATTWPNLGALEPPLSFTREYVRPEDFPNPRL